MLDAVVALSLVAVVVSGSALVRAFRAEAVTGPLAAPRCPAELVLVLDAVPAADPAAVRTRLMTDAARAAIAGLPAGSRVAALAYAAEVRWLTDPALPPLPVEELAPAPVGDDATQGGTLSAALAAYAEPTAGAAAGQRGWGAALRAATSAAAVPGALRTAGAGEPTRLVLHLVSGPPTAAGANPDSGAAGAVGDLAAGATDETASDAAADASAGAGPTGDTAAGAAGEVASSAFGDAAPAGPSGDGATWADVTAATAEVDARAATRLVTVAVGDASRLGAELATSSGPDVRTAGVGPLQVATDDVVLVPDWERLPALTAELVGGLCAPAVDPVAGAPPSDPQPPARDDLLAPSELAPPLVPTPNPGGTPDPAAASGPDDRPPGPSVIEPSQGRSSLPVAVQPGPGSPSSLTHPDTPGAGDLVVGHTVRSGNSDCPDDGADPGATAAVTALGAPVVHCLTVVNRGSAPLEDVVVEVSGAAFDSDGLTWPVGRLDVGGTARRREVTNLEWPGSVSTRATARGTAGRLGGGASVVLHVTPPAVAVDRRLGPADGPPCEQPIPTTNEDSTPAVGERAGWCLTVTNTGGTFLDQLSVLDPALSISPFTLAGTLAPGASTTTSGVLTLRDDPGIGPVARAGPVDATGQPWGGGAAVTSEADGGAGLAAEGRLSAAAVVPGEKVTTSVVVTNSSPEPVSDLRVDTNTCGSVTEPTTRLVDDRDPLLEAGEAWLYACSAPLWVEQVAVASVVTPTQTITTRPGSVATLRPDVRVQKRQRNDLRVGSQTTYELKIQNVGDATATGVIVVDQLPPGLSFVSGSSDIGACQASGSTVSCALGDLGVQEATENLIVSIVVGVDPSVVGRTITNEARVSTTGAETELSDNVSTARGRVVAAGDCAGTRDCDPNSLGGASPGSSDDSSSGSGQLPSTGGSGSTSVLGSRFALTGAEPLTVLAWASVLFAAGITLLATGRRRLLLTRVAAPGPIG